MLFLLCKDVSVASMRSISCRVDLARVICRIAPPSIAAAGKEGARPSRCTEELGTDFYRMQFATFEIEMESRYSCGEVVRGPLVHSCR